MKALIFLYLTFTSALLFAQQKIETTNQFNIEGLVKHPIALSITDLGNYRAHSIDSVVIFNHLMEKKYTMKNLKGVLLRDILDKAEIQSTSPKLLSELYLVCVASDNYKVVFSWNEIYNTKTGSSVYILVQHDGKPAASLDDRIALISTGDMATGRRYVKGLQKIIIQRVQ